MMSEVLLGTAIAITANAFIKDFAFGFNKSLAGKLRLIFIRGGICTETLERAKHKKVYPIFVRHELHGDNRVLFYKLPPGMSYVQILKGLDKIVCGLKSEIIPKYLENDPKSDFSLTVLSGKLLDYAEFTEEVLDKIKDNGLWIPLGWSRRGLEQVNLADTNSPHLLIGGSTGAGKSVLLRLIMISLHLCYDRHMVSLWLMDMKHGNEIDILGDSMLVDRRIDSAENAEGLLDDLLLELERRYTLFRSKNCNSIDAIRAKGYDERHIVLIIDEMSMLAGKDYSSARLKLGKITAIGRQAGVHVVISTHRPTANLIDGTMKNNITARVAFRCNATSARVLLGEEKEEYEAAMRIDPDVSGRALFKFTQDVLIQVPYIEEEYAREIMRQFQRPSQPIKRLEKII